MSNEVEMQNETFTITIMCSDNATFIISESIANIIPVIKTALPEQIEKDEVVPFSNISGRCFEKIIEYATFDINERPNLTDDEIKDYEKTFTPVADKKLHEELCDAAAFLDYENLLNCVCKAMQQLWKGHTAQWILDNYEVEADFPKPLTDAEARAHYEPTEMVTN